MICIFMAFKNTYILIFDIVLLLFLFCFTLAKKLLKQFTFNFNYCKIHILLLWTKVSAKYNTETHTQPPSLPQSLVQTRSQKLTNPFVYLLKVFRSNTRFLRCLGEAVGLSAVGLSL